MFVTQLILILIFTIYILQIKAEENFYVSVKDDINNPEHYGETFTTNLTSNVVILNFQTPYMLTVTEVSLFSQDIRLWRVIVAGEIAFGEPAFQTLCFLGRLGDTDLLSPESISKLRQKKPKLIRFGEEDRGEEQLVATLSVPLRLIPNSVKYYAQSLCSSAPNGIYINEEDFRTLFDEGFNGNNIVRLSTLTLPRCNTVSDWRKPCQCELKVKIAWYPCGWQYCAEETSTTVSSSSGRICGIKSCRVKRIFYYEAQKKLFCGWDS